MREHSLGIVKIVNATGNWFIFPSEIWSYETIHGISVA